MNLIRKVFWPSAIVLSLLVAMAAMGQGARTTSAQEQEIGSRPDFIAVCGPDQIAVGVTELYVFLTHDYTGPVIADLDDNEGDTDITSATQRSRYEVLDEPTDFHDFVHAVEFNPDIFEGPLEEDDIEAGGEDVVGELEDEFPSFDVADCFGMEPADLIPDIDEAIKALISEEAIDCFVPGPANVCSQAVIDAVVNALANAIAGGEFECGDLAFIANDAVINAGGGPLLAVEFRDAILAFCLAGGDVGIDTTVEICVGDEGDQCIDIDLVFDFSDIPTTDEFPIPSGVGAVDVTCVEPGEFDLSFIISIVPLPGKSTQINVACKGEVDTGVINRVPTTVEIIPSIGNVAHSLVWVVLSDIEGGPVPAGIEVTFTTDRCSIESSAVDTEEEFEAALALFGAFSPLVPSSALAVEASVAATTAPDSATRQSEETATFWRFFGPDDTENAVAAAVLHCDPVHAPGVTPGTANITAIVERGTVDDDLLGNNDDLILTTTVTVIGPPATITVTAAPSTLQCGEKAEITVTVKDSIGQNVSDHTLVEAATNFGGVLAGTGAIAGQMGLVSPVSSTVAETFGGVAKFFLLTSDAHTGPYEVVVTTGGGGGVAMLLDDGVINISDVNILGGLFTTPPISAQVTVNCSVPTPPAPPVQAPQVPQAQAPTTGGGPANIRPPSTGDAGLAQSDSSSWVFVLGAVAVASLFAAGFVMKSVAKKN